jgi:hypothetical protein
MLCPFYLEVPLAEIKTKKGTTFPTGPEKKGK